MSKNIFLALVVLLVCTSAVLAKEIVKSPQKTLDQIQAEFAADKQCALEDRSKRVEIYTATHSCINAAEDWLGLSACYREENEKLASNIVKCKSSRKKSKKH